MVLTYRPIVRARTDSYFGAALVGTHTAVIGWNMEDESLRTGLAGFAIRRTDIDAESGDTMRVEWLGGYKRFKETDDGQANAVRSCDAPFQRFRWNDYTLQPNRTYRYEVFPVRGTPTALTRDEPPLVFKVAPSLEDQDGLGLYVNRGVTSAMAYLDRFGDLAPAEVPHGGAYTWLSRGLKESLLEFIKRAKSGESLHVAIYEFHDTDVANALVAARGRNVDVSIVYDFHPEKKSTQESQHVLKDAGLLGVAIQRTTTKISHNKIVVRLRGTTPKEVWTGSANFSENAFNYQTNSAMVIRDSALCEACETYFQALSANPAKADSKVANRELMTRIGIGGDFASKVYFSPVTGLDIVDAAVELIENAESAVFVSSPFGTGKQLIGALGNNSQDIIENGLVNTTAQKTIMSLRRKNTRFYPPKRLATYMGRAWDARAFGDHKVHAKTIVVDPWGENPKVLIGSANFSEPSCVDNDENALLVVGDKRLAAVMATEFLRMFDHYQSRFQLAELELENKEIKEKNKALAAAGQPLLELKEGDIYLKTNDSWSDTAFKATSRSHKFRDRVVFSGGV
jgi:phosphatidylserine/phosphatidylglycerophosphate/cardiolipin synthase-like enzyme